MRVIRTLGVLSVVLSFALVLWALSVLPDVVPVHFNLSGKPDAYGSKYVLLILPVVILLLYILLTYLPKVDPYSSKVKERMETVRLVRDITTVFMSALNAIIVWSTFEGKFPPGSFGVLFGVLFILLGNYLPKLPHNWFVGVRTPWTLASEKVWRRTHRVFGVVFVVFGVAMMVASFLMPAVLVAVLLGGVVAITLGAAIYSYVLYLREGSAGN